MFRIKSTSSVMILLSAAFHLFFSSLAELSKSCEGTLDDECGAHETCRQLQFSNEDAFQGICVCLAGFHRDADQVCMQNSVPTASPSTSEPIIYSIASALMWTVCILGALAVTLAVLIRRFALLDRLYALRVRRYDTVFVSTAANVDDDAPIT